ncbi:CcmD family protein [Sediminibacterium roseum]|uniref:CcmD family protein n=2 Tax=Sediminibacterium roseum TaxID=1978412 RepID=A0ABW9ZZ46_9BACT|nr:CcmD family protein [Sediminibacterium roseum]
MFLFAFTAATTQAQETVANPENADLMRSNGKLYVVVAVVVTILIGLFFYVYSLDRKISKLEKK